MLFTSVHTLNTVKEIQSMHSVTVYLSNFVFFRELKDKVW
jgi:hypothetical protein